MTLNFDFLKKEYEKKGFFICKNVFNKDFISLLIAEINKAQMEVNKVEAGHTSMFVAGWRPFTGWICASALAYHYIIQPLLTFILYSFGNEVVLPTFDMGTLTTVLLGMLGLGGMRSFEKVKRSA